MRLHIAILGTLPLILIAYRMKARKSNSSQPLPKPAICAMINAECNGILKSKCPLECSKFEKQADTPNSQHLPVAVRNSVCKKIHSKCPPFLEKECPNECKIYESSDTTPKLHKPADVKKITPICEQVLQRKERCVEFLKLKCKDQCAQFEPKDDAPERKRGLPRGRKSPLCAKITSRCATFMAELCPLECGTIVIVLRKKAQERWGMIRGHGLKPVSKPVRTVAEYCLFHPFAQYVREDKENFGLTIACTGSIGSGLEACFFNKNSPGETCRNTYQKLDACELDSEDKFEIPLVAAYDVERSKESFLRGALTDESLLDSRITVKFEQGHEWTYRLADDTVQIDKHAICSKISSRCSPFLVPHCPDECAHFEEDSRIADVEKSISSFNDIQSEARSSGRIEEIEIKPKTGTAVDICQLPQYTDLHREDDNTHLLYIACDDEQGSGFEICVFRSHAPGLQSCMRSYQHLASCRLTSAGEFEIPMVQTFQVGQETFLRGKIAARSKDSEIIWAGHVYHY